MRGSDPNRWNEFESGKHWVTVNALGSKLNEKTPNFTPETLFFGIEVVLLE